MAAKRKKAQLKDLVIEEDSTGGDSLVYDVPANGMMIGRENKSPGSPRFPHPEYPDERIRELSLSVSRRHCMVYFADGQLGVKDMSRNGTYINDRRVPKDKGCVLRDGDVLGLGT